MTDGVGQVATVLAVVLVLIALVTFTMELYVVAGTCLTFTAFAIYIRETRG